jgi:hypothetical protein
MMPQSQRLADSLPSVISGVLCAICTRSNVHPVAPVRCQSCCLRSPESVDAARDKSETRASMARAGLPTPRNRLIERPDQVEAAGQHVGFPAGEKGWLKPHPRGLRV